MTERMAKPKAKGMSRKHATQAGHHVEVAAEGKHEGEAGCGSEARERKRGLSSHR